MGARCRIQLLGGLRVQCGDRTITRFRTRKAAALLAYLAYHLGQVCPREVLAELLWPESEPGAGRTNLRHELASLRHQCEPPGTPAGAVIHADGFGVELNASVVTTDVREFGQALLSARGASSALKRLHHLTEAIRLYEGPLLPGHYEEWVVGEQARLADHYLHALEQATALLEEAGEVESALDLARRAAEVEPLREEAHWQLIRLLARAGRSAAAVRQYREFASTLQKEVGGTPSAALGEFVQRLPPPRDEIVSPPVRKHAPRVRAPSMPPSGTLTFLLIEFLGTSDSVPADLAKRIRAQALRRHGYEVTYAAGLLALVFRRASEALSCAVAAHRAVSGAAGTEGAAGPVVRMALHTEEADLGQDRERSAALERVGALLLATPPHQILCSEGTAAMLHRDRQEPMQLQGLGSYRLRDEGDPERLFALRYPGMTCETCPALDLPGGYAADLPVAFTRFFGRDDELARLQEMVLTEGRHLVTLIGPAGSGKTRLAQEAARHLLQGFQGAVWFVPLQDVTDSRLIATTVRDAMRLPTKVGIEALEQAVEALARQPSLLVLDNLEQLGAEGACVVQLLLTRVPALSCMVTSRHALNLAGERQLPVLPLPTPEGEQEAEALARCASVRLFVDRAQAARPDFQVTKANAPAISQLCDRLEGIPLAIELAAARAQVLTPSQMLGALQHRFNFLVSRKRDAVERHRTLHAALEWSYRLLSSKLQRFFLRLSVFRGGYTAEAAEVVCQEPEALECLAQLAECSLVLADQAWRESAGTRFRMLETLREYGQETLSPEEALALRRRHVAYYLAMAEELGPTLHVYREERAVSLARLEEESGNLRAALEFLKSGADGVEEGLRLGAGLCRFWVTRGRLTEGRKHLEDLLARKDARGSAATRGYALWVASFLARLQGDCSAERALLEEDLAISRESGNTGNTAGALGSLGEQDWASGDYVTARARLQESWELDRQRPGLSHHRVAQLGHLAAIIEADFATSRELQQSALSVAREVRDNRGAVLCLEGLGAIAQMQGDYAAALALLEEGLALTRELADEAGIARSLGYLGACLAEQGDHVRAQELLEEALASHRALDDRPGQAHELSYMGHVSRKQGELVRARPLLEEALAISRERGAKPYIAFVLREMGLLALSERDYGSAPGLLRESLRMERQMGYRPGVAWSLEGLAGAYAEQGQVRRAARLLGAAEALRKAIGCPLPASESCWYEREVAAIKAGLGDDAFQSVWEEGRAMLWEEAVAYALEGNNS